MIDGGREGEKGREGEWGRDRVRREGGGRVLYIKYII